MFEEEVRLGVATKKTKRIPCYVSDTSHDNQSVAYMQYMRCQASDMQSLLPLSGSAC